MKAHFTIDGEPKGKGRPRVMKGGYAYTPHDTAVYENLVKVEYRRQCGKTFFENGTFLDVRISAYYGIPNSASGKKKKLMNDNIIRPTKKPDMDNICKIICDALNKIAYYDDAQIVDCQLRKFYSEHPRVVVTISEAKPIR